MNENKLRVGHRNVSQWTANRQLSVGCSAKRHIYLVLLLKNWKQESIAERERERPWLCPGARAADTDVSYNCYNLSRSVHTQCNTSTVNQWMAPLLNSTTFPPVHPWAGPTAACSGSGDGSRQVTAARERSLHANYAAPLSQGVLLKSFKAFIPLCWPLPGSCCCVVCSANKSPSSISGPHGGDREPVSEPVSEWERESWHQVRVIG